MSKAGWFEVCWVPRLHVLYRESRELYQGQLKDKDEIQYVIFWDITFLSDSHARARAVLYQVRGNTCKINARIGGRQYMVEPDKINSLSLAWSHMYLIGVFNLNWYIIIVVDVLCYLL